jgi:HEPN domain-containing protein
LNYLKSQRFLVACAPRNDKVGAFFKGLAEGELSMARYLLQGGFYKGACYHAQQSVEKSAKAKLIEKGWDLERIHSIERLMVLGKDYRIKYPLNEKEALFVDAIYRGRYPAEAGLLPLGEPALADAQKAVQIAEKMLAFSASKLKTVKTLILKT